MKDTLIFILKSIVDKPEKVVVEEQSNDQRNILTVTVDESDMGKVIGKRGRIIKAIRDLIKIIAAKNKTYIDVIINE